MAAELVGGIAVDGPGWLILAALVSDLVNATVRRPAFLLMLPLTGLLLPGFHVEGFRPAVFGAVVAAAGWLARRVLGGARGLG